MHIRWRYGTSQLLLLLFFLSFNSVSFASSYTLRDSRWSLLTVPANASTQTIEQLFADDLPSASYGDTWAIHTFNQQTQTYDIPAIDSSLSQGDGFWMIQTTGADAVIDLADGMSDGDAVQSDACASSEGCFSARLTTSDTRSNWSILGVPYSRPVEVTKIRVQSSDGNCTNGCDLAQAKSEGLLLGEQWIYDATTGQYSSLASLDLLQPWHGFWVLAAASSNSADLSILFPKPEGDSPANAQGLHTSYDELFRIRTDAINGNTRYQEYIERVAAKANEGWPYGDVGTPFGGTSRIDSVYDKECLRLGEPQLGGILPNAGVNIYSMVLSYILTDNVSYAEQVKNILLNFADSSGFDTVVDGTVELNGANQCALEISWLTPLLIESALLLEAYPEWTSADKTKVQSWLAAEVYPLTAAIARKRKNNWGTAAAFASWAIGHYLNDSTLVLNEVYPVDNSFSAAQAKDEHLQTQLNIIGNTWAGDTGCANYGFQPHGGYPDELRRGSTGCDGTYLVASDASFAYQITTMEHLVYHAEALKRHSDNELYQYTLSNGEPLILKAITFVIDNPNGTSHDWRNFSLGTVRVANSFFNDSRLCEQLDKGIYFEEGRYIPFSKLTYPEVCQ